MKEETIKRCPICGHNGDPVKENTRVFHGSEGSRTERDYYLECDNCQMCIGNDKMYDYYGDNVCDYNTREEAIQFWNNTKIHVDYDALQSRFDKLEELSKVQEEYIKFLGDEVSRTAVYLHVHNMGASEEIVNEGIRLRTELDRLRAGLTQK